MSSGSWDFHPDFVVHFTWPILCPGLACQQTVLVEQLGLMWTVTSSFKGWVSLKPKFEKAFFIELHLTWQVSVGQGDGVWLVCSEGRVFLRLGVRCTAQTSKLFSHDNYVILRTLYPGSRFASRIRPDTIGFSCRHLRRVRGSERWKLVGLFSVFLWFYCTYSKWIFVMSSELNEFFANN